MVQGERAIRDRQEEKVEEGHRQKKGHQTLSDRLKAPDEGMVGSQFEPAFDRHAALLGGASTDVQRASLAIHLQQTYGNQYVQRLVESIKVQAKLTVGSPDDEYEREADQVADAVTRPPTSSVQRQAEEEEEEEEEPEEEVQAKLTVGSPDDEYEREADQVADAITRAPASSVQRQAEEPEEEEGEEEEEPVVEVRTKISRIQRQVKEPEEEELVAAKPASEIQNQSFAVSEDLEAGIKAARGSGQPLPDSVRNSLEPQLGHDFSQVHIHTDADADKLSQQLSAEAFTTGSDIFFKDGAYQPGSDSGKGLIAHELTHVMQQSAAPALQRQKDIPGGPEKPPKTTSDPKEVAAKVLEAASKTELGKKYTKKLMKAATSEEGIIVLSTLAVPALTAAFAEKMEVPQGLVGLVPKIAKFEVGKNIEVSFQPIYKGTFGEKPKEWGGMVYLTVKRW
jgi:hypothetical protein